LATGLERRIELNEHEQNVLGSKISSLHHTLATELDQKFWPPNSHSKSTTLGQEGLGFRVAKKAYQNHF
jgi:hypothetical protein